MIAIFFLATILISGSIQERSPLEGTLINLLVPLTTTNIRLLREIRDTWNNMITFRETMQENTRLQIQLRELLKEHQRYQEVLNENERLRELLGYSVKTPYRTISAEVIGYDPSNWFHTLCINRGQRDGLRKDQAVIGYQGEREGLIGRISYVQETWSEVLLILSQNSALGAKILRTQFKGVVEGQNSRLCRLKYIPYDADLEIGDTLITSGKGGIFPEGLPIGEVARIEKEKQGLFLEAQVSPFIEFAKLEDVLVIVEE